MNVKCNIYKALNINNYNLNIKERHSRCLPYFKLPAVLTKSQVSKWRRQKCMHLEDIILKLQTSVARIMTQQVQAPAAETDNVSSILATHMVALKYGFLCTLSSYLTCKPSHLCTLSIPVTIVSFLLKNQAFRNTIQVSQVFFFFLLNNNPKRRGGGGGRKRKKGL